MGLLGKSEQYALNIVGNSVYQKVGNYFLTSVFKDYCVRTSTIQPKRKWAF